MDDQLSALVRNVEAALAAELAKFPDRGPHSQSRIGVLAKRDLFGHECPRLGIARGPTRPLLEFGRNGYTASTIALRAIRYPSVA